MSALVKRDDRELLTKRLVRREVVDIDTRSPAMEERNGRGAGRALDMSNAEFSKAIEFNRYCWGQRRGESL